MPPPYARHLFVCTNRRPEGSSKGCCASKGSEALRDALKAEVGRRGLAGSARVNAAGCLDACARGPVVVVYPDGVWYGPVTAADVPELVEEHLVSGRPVERLRMKPY
jgi:(2Fe-2S) ferredoxin